MPTPKLFTNGSISVETPPTIPFPADALNAVKAARLAGKIDLEIVDVLENRGVERPSRYGFTDSGATQRWHPPAIAALRAQLGIA